MLVHTVTHIRFSHKNLKIRYLTGVESISRFTMEVTLYTNTHTYHTIHAYIFKLLLKVVGTCVKNITESIILTLLCLLIGGDILG